MVGAHYNANINYEKWRITYDPALPSPTFLLDSETKIFTAGTTTLAKWLTIKSTASGSAGGQNGQGLALTEIPEHLIYIGFASTYRITVSELTLYNVCPPETE
jgi:hypothetical protein